MDRWETKIDFSNHFQFFLPGKISSLIFESCDDVACHMTFFSHVLWLLQRLILLLWCCSLPPGAAAALPVGARGCLAPEHSGSVSHFLRCWSRLKQTVLADVTRRVVKGMCDVSGHPLRILINPSRCSHPELDSDPEKVLKLKSN